MHDEDAVHPNPSLQEKLQQIYTLRKQGRVNFDDNRPYLALLERLGNPHLRLPPVIHIAGTNGKGSTLAMIRAALEAASHRVHAYTSPHLHLFNERIYLGQTRAPISDPDLESLLDEIFAVNGDNQVSFFEFTTALAFLAFSRFGGDIVLLETGMGGRLDCTNVIPKPLLCIITPIDYDHMEFLGDTLEKIAFEKAGIFKTEVPCIIAPQSCDKIIAVLKEHAARKNTPLLIGDDDFQCRDVQTGIEFTASSLNITPQHHPYPNLRGAHQILNAGTALAALHSIQASFPLHNDHINHGLTHIKWPGRLENKSDSPRGRLLPTGWELWFDGMHNKAGAAAMSAAIKQWRDTPPKSLHLILGMKENKDINGVIDILSPCATSLHRIKIGDDLTPVIADIVAKNNSNAPARILICGSLYHYNQI